MDAVRVSEFSQRITQVRKLLEEGELKSKEERQAGKFVPSYVVQDISSDADRKWGVICADKRCVMDVSSFLKGEIVEANENR